MERRPARVDGPRRRENKAWSLAGRAAASMVIYNNQCQLSPVTFCRDGNGKLLNAGFRLSLSLYLALNGMDADVALADLRRISTWNYRRKTSDPNRRNCIFFEKCRQVISVFPQPQYVIFLSWISGKKHKKIYLIHFGDKWHGAINETTFLIMYTVMQKCAWVS